MPQAPTSRIELPWHPPLDWDWMLAFLRRRTVTGVERAGEDGRYRRALRVEGPDGARTGWVEVAPATDGRPVLVASLSPALAQAAEAVAATLRRLFDLDRDPAEVNRVLGPLAEGRSGLRVPGAVDGCELAVRGILGQQVTVAAAHTLAGRVVARFGLPVDTPFVGVHHVFPPAARLAAVPPEDIAALGVLRGRAVAIVELARAVADGRVTLSPGADPEATMRALCGLPGIGEWTAQYVAMRALAWADAFPATDLGVMQALGTRRRAEALARAEAWRPFRAYAVMHLWSRL